MEIMIVVTIIGLLAAMLVPAIQKVREARITKAIKNGEKITPEQRKWYNEFMKDRRTRNGDVDTTSEVPVALEGIPFQTLKVGDKVYVLVPKQNAQETSIGGQTFWLVPAP